MNIHEYQAKEVIKKYGVAVLEGHVAWTPEEAVEAARKLPVDRSKLPPFLDEVLGHPFYRTDSASSRTRDYLLDPGADAERLFRAAVDDVAQDVGAVRFQALRQQDLFEYV